MTEPPSHDAVAGHRRQHIHDLLRRHHRAADPIGQEPAWLADAARDLTDFVHACLSAHQHTTGRASRPGGQTGVVDGAVRNPRPVGRARVPAPPCPCDCNSGGFCGGCGHPGCGNRR